MPDHSIELELRAKLSSTEKTELLDKLSNIGKPISTTKRLSVMFFGEIEQKKIDIRVRVTNGTCEVVVKSGNFGSHNRTEVTQDIHQNQLVGMVKLFSPFNFLTKVGERETINYALPGDITASIVSAGDIAYLELEKMSTIDTEQENYIELTTLANSLGVTTIKSEDEFEELCKRLNDTVDWFFHYTSEDYSKLESSLQKYFH